jgi:DNA-binding response OmpR family regulator
MVPTPPTGHPPPTVLVVDDEPVIRETLAIFLEAEGYAVRTAPDGLAALAELEHGGIGLVLSDVMMPRLDGLALARRLRCRQPAVPVVLMSAVAPIPELPEVPVLHKPFALERLIDVIVTMLTHVRDASAANSRGGMASGPHR